MSKCWESLGVTHRPNASTTVDVQTVEVQTTEGNYRCSLTGSADPKVKANDIAIHVIGMLVRRDTDTIDVLGQFISSRDVIVCGDISKRRSGVNQDDAVLGVDVLDGLQEIAEKGLMG